MHGRTPNFCQLMRQLTAVSAYLPVPEFFAAYAAVNLSDIPDLDGVFVAYAAVNLIQNFPHTIPSFSRRHAAVNKGSNQAEPPAI